MTVHHRGSPARREAPPPLPSRLNGWARAGGGSGASAWGFHFSRGRHQRGSL